MNTADTAFVLICSALVLLMTPGLSLFYGGMVRSKNILSLLMQNFSVMALMTLVWVLYGYTLGFGNDHLGIIGDLSMFGLRGVGLEPSQNYADTIPHLSFVAFQGMFLIITAALITGSVAERLRFGPFILFMVLWATLVYIPVCHWVWGKGGWIGSMGALDFAGGTVVHISSGFSGYALAISTGKRHDYGRSLIAPHNLPITILGAGILWFGWFGFNAGSALKADGIASLAFMTTHAAASMGGLGWLIVEWWIKGKPTTLGIASGLVAGLVGITPAAGFVGITSALIIGFFAGIFCYLGVRIKEKTGVDDSLDVLGIHGIGGLWGCIATGLFASKAINPGGADGLFAGNFGMVIIQTLPALFVAFYSFIMSSIIARIMRYFLDIRASREDELKGLDLSMHDEAAYDI